MSRALVVVFLASLGTTMSFYLLLSVVPQYATSLGAGGVGAGASTGALMLTTVAAELAAPGLAARFGDRAVLAAGLVLLGAPALALPAASSLAAILALSAVRGVGFAMLVVVVGALVASLVPPERRGEGLGVYGIVVGVPAIGALPLGVWLAGHAGYPPVFVAGGIAALAGLAAIPGLPRARPAVRRAAPAAPSAPTPERPLGILEGLRTGALVRPAIAFSTTSMAAGAAVTFLPLAATQASGGVAALALLAQSAVATLTRWWAGRTGDRHGSLPLLAPALPITAAGMLALIFVHSPIAVVLGMVAFGAGFGIAQNVSLSVMFDRAPASGYGTVSALWNLAYDAGLGVGGAGFGVVAVHTGYAAAFGITGAVMLAAMIPLWLDRAATRRRG